MVVYRARTIVVQDKAVALIRREREGRTYYVFPGGGQEPGETPEQTAIRETREELGLKVELDRLLAEVMYHGRTQYYFLAHTVGGRFGTGQGPEMLGKYPRVRGTYTPVWVSLDHIDQIPLVPAVIARIVQRAPEYGWPEKTLIIREDETDTN